VEKYITTQKEKVGSRFCQIRQWLGYSTSDFAILLGLTESTILNIEKGEGFSSNTICIVSFFTNLSLKELFDYSGALPGKETFQKTFLRKVKQYNSAGLDRLNKKRTSIKSILEQLIKETNFFKTPRQTRDVREFLQEEYQIDATSSVVSQSLTNAFHEGLLKRKIITVRNYLYYR